MTLASPDSVRPTPVECYYRKPNHILTLTVKSSSITFMRSSFFFLLYIPSVFVLNGY